MFAIFLTLATFITGIFWCLERYRWKPARQRKVEAVRQQTEGKIDGQVLAKVGQSSGLVDLLSSLFPILCFVFVLRSFIIEPFQIPSGSMMPTLLVGDFIIVEKYSYGIKDPITNTTLIPTGKPQRGDVAVFKNPNNTSIDFVKRVVGIPGDKIVYDEDKKELRIYPACQAEDQQCSQQQVIPLDLNSRQETIGGHTHDILLIPNQLYQSEHFFKQPNQKLGEWVVPEGYYFMMGDNRNNSDDSRFWGFVPERNFVGRVSAIWLSLEKQPDEWPTSIRFSRIGKVN